MNRWVAILIAVVISMAPPEFWVLTIFVNLLDTLMHESSHALASLLFGGHVNSIQLNLNGSGVTWSSGGITWLTTAAGYTGVAIMSGIFLRMMALKLDGLVLWCWIGLLLWCLVLSGGLSLPVIAILGIPILIIFVLPKVIRAPIVGVLVIAVLLHSMTSVLSLYQLPYGTHHDAFLLAQRTALPEVFWKAFMFMVTAVAIVTSIWSLPTGSQRGLQTKRAVV